MRGPSTPRIAGSSVSAASTEKKTTTTPATPTERRNMKGKTISATRPISTVRPEKKIARPAVSTVTATASPTGRAGSSSRKREVMKSA